MGPDSSRTTGFHVLMPPGWARFMVDAEGKRALIARVSARMRELSRPDLDAQARSMIESYWRSLTAGRISAIYLPSEPTVVGTLPLSIAVKQHMAPPVQEEASLSRGLRFQYTILTPPTAEGEADADQLSTIGDLVMSTMRWIPTAHH